MVAGSTVAAALEGVSPGAVDRVARVEQRCPTFNWEADHAAVAYELVAYGLPVALEDAAIIGAPLDDAEVALYAALPGGATGWTPSVEQCLAPGDRVVWFVRAVYSLDGDAVGETGEWSQGRYLKVTGAPTVAEVERALEVLQAYAASGGVDLGAVSTEWGQDTPRPAAGSTARVEAKSALTAPAAVRGEHPDTSGEAYGVVGTAAASDGAGVAAAHLAGGPDLVLDGTADGAPSVTLSEWGLDRSSAQDQVFTFTNSGAGELELRVQGTVSGWVVAADEVWAGGHTVIDDTGTWLGQGSTVPCQGCVDTTDLAEGAVDSRVLGNGEVTDVDLAPDAVTSSHIVDGTVTADDLAANAVTSATILDGSIATSDLADHAVTDAKIAAEAVGSAAIEDGSIQGVDIDAGAITSGQILDGSITAGDLADGAVTSSKIAPQAVGAAAIENAAVDTEHLRDGGVASADLATGAVTSATIADGTVDYMDIAPGAIRSVQIYDGMVMTNDLAADAVTTDKIADGTITAADVSATGGIYSSREAVYYEENTADVPAGGSSQVSASCRDIDDLPLAGGCYLNDVASNIYLRRSLPSGWDSDLSPATHLCVYVNKESVVHTAVARIFCIEVPESSSR